MIIEYEYNECELLFDKLQKRIVQSPSSSPPRNHCNYPRSIHRPCPFHHLHTSRHPCSLINTTYHLSRLPSPTTQPIKFEQSLINFSFMIHPLFILPPTIPLMMKTTPLHLARTTPPTTPSQTMNPLLTTMTPILTITTTSPLTTLFHSTTTSLTTT